MKSIAEHLSTYHSYHTKKNTQLTHYIGIPLVVFSLLIFLGWFHVTMPGIFDIHFAWLATLAIAIYYFKLDWQLAIIATVGLIILNILASFFSQPTPDALGFYVFIIAFIAGWGLQFLGHYFEGKRPAFMDNFCQALIAPMYLAAEAMFAVGMRKELRAAVSGHQ